eukprot:9084129-Pyramimonas_sp.AAC.1
MDEKTMRRHEVRELRVSPRHGKNVIFESEIASDAVLLIDRGASGRPASFDEDVKSSFCNWTGMGKSHA